MKKEKKNKKKRNNDREHDRDDIGRQERLLVKDADFTTLSMQMLSLSLPRSIDENNKFLESVLSSVGPTPVIHSRLFGNLYKSLSSAMNPLSSYISLNPSNADFLVKHGNYYYANFFNYLTPASSNIKYKKHDNLQNSTGRREELKSQRTQMQPPAQMQNIESTYLSRNYFPQAVSQLRPPPLFTPTAASENTSMTKNASIMLHTDLQANRIANSFSADAVTIGKDIFFAKGKYDIFSPQGIALIQHELQHVRQQQTNQDLAKANSNTSTSSSSASSIPASLSFSLEKEALETEKNVLMYFALFEDYIRRYQLPSSLITSLTNMNINSDVQTKYLYPIPKIGNYSEPHPLSNAFRSSLMNFYSDSGFEHGNFSDSSYEMLIRNGLHNLKTWSLPLEGIGASPNLVSSPIIVTARNPTPTGHQDITTDVPRPSHDLIHRTSAMTPFLADSARSLPGPAPVSQLPLSPTSSPLSINANTNMQHPVFTSGYPNHTDFTADLDHLSDRVYQMIMEKIKIQREQRGFR